MSVTVFDTPSTKEFRSPGYNYVFDRITGFFARWGETYNDDPKFSPFGPELLDIEISTVCSNNCKFCYKGNTSSGINMSLEMFKDILAKFKNDNVCQIAFGIGDIDANPDMWAIFDHCRSKNIIPNLTINGMGMNKDHYRRLASVLGACAVSHYSDDVCFNAVANLQEAGLQQVNIHKVLSEESYQDCWRMLDVVKTDVRLAKLNALLFLLLKPRGRAVGTTHSLTDMEKYTALVKKAFDNRISLGMDSCSAPMFLKAMENLGRKNDVKMLNSVEPCESFGLFSGYINAAGYFFPCSFAEGEGEWKDGIYVPGVQDFTKDIWFSDKLNEWREYSIRSSQQCLCNMKAYCRRCPIFDITPCYS